MKFIDEAVVQISSGKGGDGAVSGRRELYIARGGPSGGNGGKGGSVWIKGSIHENTLLTYKFNKKFSAPSGENGKSKEQYGKNADDLELVVPLGTLIRDSESGELMAHITQHEERICLLEGGQGGIGNMHFSTSTHQYPSFAILGEPGHRRTFKFELGLLADIALIGTPSVGKSSIINTISATKAKVADYPFTTLVPHLGSVQHHDISFNVLDIPGLVEGAAGGKGLGNAFLRHILKSKILCFVSDASRFDTGMTEFGMIFEELLTYLKAQYEQPIEFRVRSQDHLLICTRSQDGRILGEKILWRVMNKSDLVEDAEIRKELEKALCDHIQGVLKHYTPLIPDKPQIMWISAITHEGVDNMLDAWTDILTNPNIQALSSFVLEKQTPEIHTKKSKADAITLSTNTFLPVLIEQNYLNEGDETPIRTIDDPDVSRLSFIVAWGNDEAELRYWKVMDKEGWLQRFEQAGIERGDILHIVSYYEEHKDRFIRFQ